MTREERLKYCSVCKNREMDINQGILCSLTKTYATFENECPNYIADEPAVMKESEKQKALENSKKVSGWLAFFLWVGLGCGGLLSLFFCIAEVVNEGWGILFSTLYLTTGITLFAVAIYAIWAFYNKKSNAVTIAKTYIGMIILDGLVGLIFAWMLNDGASYYQTFRQFIWAAIWYSFLIKSDDVEFLIPKETRTWGKFEKITLTVFIGCLIIFICSIVYVKESSNLRNIFFSNSTYITQSIEETNRELPMEISEGLMLQRVTIDNETVIYTFQFTSSYKYEVEEDYLSGNAKVHKHEILYGFYNNPKSDEFNATCFDEGYTLVYRYIDALEDNLYQIEITPKEYAAAVKSDPYKCPMELISSFIDEYNTSLPVDYMGDSRLNKISQLNESTILYEVTLPPLSVDELQGINSEYLRNYIIEEWGALSDFVIRLAVINKMTIGFQFNTHSGLNYLRVNITPNLYNQFE